MSLDGAHLSPDESPEPAQSARATGDRSPDVADVRGPGGQGAGQENDTPRALTDREERIAEYWRNRQAVDAVHPPEARNDTAPEQDTGSVDLLRKRVMELEADKAATDQRLATQDAKLAAQARTIAEQDERVERLEAYVGRITESVQELRQTHVEAQPSAEIAGRAKGGEAEQVEWDEPQHRRRLPTDDWNDLISAVGGGVITDLAYHLHDLSPEVAGIGASGLAVGAGLVAIWREHRKANDDDRPNG